MGSSESFSPDWTSAPGETIADILNERDLSFSAFTDLMGLEPRETSELLEGRSTISISVARKLTKVLGASVGFWVTRDAQYRQDSRRIHSDGKEWIRQLPLGDMIKFGWISPTPRPSEEFATCLKYFDVPSVSIWRRRYKDLLETVAFRSSPSLDSQPAAVAAWLRQGEIEAGKIECRPWNLQGFREALKHARSMTRYRRPSHFLPKLREVCAENGVAIVIVRAPKGCSASGATRFVNPKKAVLQLSFRFLSEDQFWFTFFHEAAHLLLHGEKYFPSGFSEGNCTWILEGIEPTASEEEEEKEANHFAAHILIPEKFLADILELPPRKKDVIRFAVRMGVSPGIVVGQMQFFNRIGHDRLNSLKRRYKWVV